MMASGVRLCRALALLALAVPGSAWANSDSQIWGGVNATADLGGNFRLSQEVVGRFSDNRNGLYEIESNTLLGYRLNKQVTLWGGYTHDPQYAAGHFTVMEHRLREQATFDNVAKIGRGTLNLRLRLEQRWRDGLAGTGWRFRPYAKFALPFTEGGKTALVLNSEAFLDLNTTSFQRVKGLERMRNFVGISTPINKKLGIEIGYLNQHGFVPNAPDTNDHVAMATLNLSL